MNDYFWFRAKQGYTSKVSKSKCVYYHAVSLDQVFHPRTFFCQVEKALSRVKEELLSKRYRYNTGLLMADVRKTLKWADGKAVKSEIDVQVAAHYSLSHSS